ncbi:hypothetical protein DFH07DRAFT_681021, partial [Mycena maculata]
DAGSTSNMPKHAIQCFGQNVADAAMDGEAMEHSDGSISAAFAGARQRPVNITHHAHTNAEARLVLNTCSLTANIVKWVAQSTRAPHLVNDRGL